MLYYVLDLLERLYHPPGFGIVRYLTARAAAAAVTALVISFWLGPVIIRMLRRKQIGEAAKLEAPKTHLTKAGTPTMGGLIVLAALIIPTLLWANLGNIYIVLILFVTVVLGAVGFLDDYLKVVKQKPKGLIGRYKIDRPGPGRAGPRERDLLLPALDRSGPLEAEHVHDGAVHQAPGI